MHQDILRSYFPDSTACIKTQYKCPTWISEGPGSVHVSYVCSDADCQDAVHQSDKATVPFVAPGPVHITQDEVEQCPAEQAQECTNNEEGHVLF